MKTQRCTTMGDSRPNVQGVEVGLGLGRLRQVGLGGDSRAIRYQCLYFTWTIICSSPCSLMDFEFPCYRGRCIIAIT